MYRNFLQLFIYFGIYIDETFLLNPLSSFYVAVSFMKSHIFLLEIANIIKYSFL